MLVDPMCCQQGRMCKWQTILMQPGEIEEETHTSCVSKSGSCVSVATSATHTSLSNPIITDTHKKSENR